MQLTKKALLCISAASYLAACSAAEPLSSPALPRLEDAAQTAVRPSPVAGPAEPSEMEEIELTVDAAVDIAVRDNPGLAEMNARAQALGAIPSQVGTLADPVISFNAMNLPTDTFDLSQEPMTQLQVGLSQVFPFPGKLGLDKAAAEHEATAAGEDVAEARLRLVRDVKQTWWNLFYLDRALETVVRNQRLLRQFVEIAQTKYRVGQGLQQDVLLAQVELSKLLDLEIQLTGMRRTEQARLAALLNWPSGRAVSIPRAVRTELPRVVPEARLQQRAQAKRPLLAAAASRIEAARKRLARAKRDYYPDFKVGTAYGFRSGSDAVRGSRADFASLMLSMNVPVFAARKQAKAVDQRSSELLKQRFALQDRVEQVREEIASALADYRRAREQFELFKTGIVPQARQTVAAMLAGYQVNKVDFLNLVSAQITLYNYETRYWQALSAAYQALAALAAAVGEAPSDE